MRMTVRAVILNAILIMGLFSSLFGCSKKPTLDEWGLDQLKQAGDDLSKPHKLEFVLSFSTQSVAEQASPKLRSAGFGVEVKQDGSDWRCLTTPDGRRSSAGRATRFGPACMSSILREFR